MTNTKASRAETSGGQPFRRFKCIVYKTDKTYEILNIYEFVKK